VQTASAVTGAGVAELWETLGKFFATGEATGATARRRREQAVAWMHALIEESLRADFYGAESVRARRGEIERAVAEGSISPATGALALLGK
jgi:LAO/AO transport system kinase